MWPPRTSIILLLMAAWPAFSSVSHAESGRIKHKRPSADEQQRALSEAVMNDGSLQIGDIVVTDRGYFVFEGIGEDGFTSKFRHVADPSAGTPVADKPAKRQRNGIQ